MSLFNVTPGGNPTCSKCGAIMYPGNKPHVCGTRTLCKRANISMVRYDDPNSPTRDRKTEFLIDYCTEQVGHRTEHKGTHSTFTHEHSGIGFDSTHFTQCTRCWDVHPENVECRCNYMATSVVWENRAIVYDAHTGFVRCRKDNPVLPNEEPRKPFRAKGRTEAARVIFGG